MKNKLLSFSILILLIVALAFTVGQPVLKVTYPKAADGMVYTLFHQEAHAFTFEMTRPQKKEQDVLLCIPAAFTALDSGGIEGFHMKDGLTFNAKRVNHGVGGGCRITNGNVSIFPTSKGKIINDSLIKLLKKNKASFFQQIQIVTNGVAATFKDKSLFQRRAVYIDKKGAGFVIESSKPVTLERFSNDLVFHGAWNAVYTDMGAWDEGWYRDEKNYPVIIGKILTATERQTNWVTIRVRKKNK